jgi:RHS repeat-associated protein
VTGANVVGSAARGLWAAGALGWLCALALAFARRTRRYLRPAVALAAVALVVAPGCGGQGGGGGEGSRASVYYLTDHLGSSSVVVDGAGAVQSVVAYDAWGRQRSGTAEPWTFTGQEWDEEAGLYHFGKRYYDPELGRFLSTDPIVLDGPEPGITDPQTLNPYSYARNTPTSLTDRDGRFAHILVGALVGAGVNTAIYLIKAAINGEKVTVRGALAAAASGAVAGAVGAATLGVGLVVSAAASGVASGVVERGINTGSVTKAFDAQAMAGDALMGAAGVGVGAVAAKVARPVLKAAGAAAGRLGGQVKTALCPVVKKLRISDGCFVAGTIVWLATGAAIPIEQVEVGDEVLAPADPLDPESPLQAHRVIEESVRQVDGVVDLLVERADGEGELLSVTVDHPFAVHEAGGLAWRKAGELQAGAILEAQTGRAVVRRAGIRLGETAVFNLEVEGAHAYLVGSARALVHNGTCPTGAKVATPYGPAVQADTVTALAARTKVEKGATLFRIGTTGKSAAGEAQFWALEHPMSPGFAQRYGIPPENITNANFIEAATLKPGTPFVTRPAPGFGPNPGGGIEVVVPSGGVQLKSFSAGGEW